MATEEEEDGDWLPTVNSEPVISLVDTAQYFTAAESSAVILVLGESAASKAQFIQQLTRSEEVHISEDGQSEWESIQAYPMIFGGLSLSLVELPTYHLETERIFEVAKWLSSMYTFGHRITGLIYLYPIDQEDKSPSRSKLRALENLVGFDAVKDIVLVTTNWDQISEASGSLVENTILKPWWSPLMDGGGSAMLRWLGDRGSALEVVNHIISRQTSGPAGPWKIQRELAVEGRAFPQTSVGRTLKRGLEKRQQHHIDQLEEITLQAAEVMSEEDASTVVRLDPEERKTRENLELVRVELLALENCTSDMKTQEEDTKRFVRFMAHWERRLCNVRHQASFVNGDPDTADRLPRKSERPALIDMSASLNSFPWRSLLLVLNLVLGAYAVFDIFRNSGVTTTSTCELIF